MPVSVAIFEHEEDMLDYTCDALIEDAYRVHIPEEVDGTWFVVLSEKQ